MKPYTVRGVAELGRNLRQFPFFFFFTISNPQIFIFLGQSPLLSISPETFLKMVMMILMIVYKSGNGEDDDGDYFDQGMPRQLQTSSGPDLLQTSHSSPSNSPKCQNVGNKTRAGATIKISF